MKELIKPDSILLKFDIWNENNDIVTSKLNKPFREMINKGDLNRAAYFVEELSAYPCFANISNKVSQFKSLLNKFENMGDLAGAEYKPILLKQFSSPNRNISLEYELHKLAYGKYIIFFSDEKFSNYQVDFEFLDEKTKKLLVSKDFDVKVSRRFPIRLMVMNNAKFHNFHNDFFTVSDENDVYDANNAAVLAGQTSKSFIREKIYKSIERAIVLPFDHTSINYYHNLTECFFGLRYFDYNKYDYPIIYTRDKFSLISTIADRLNININRFLSIDEVSDCVVKEAYCFYKGGYYWDKTIYQFANKLKRRVIENPSRKIYISRSKSSRSYSNEKQIEGFLTRKGFDIIYAEDLTFAEQIDLFADVKFLISAHGAGLTNICFMNKGTKIIEFFEPGMIKADYYLRSIHNDMDYSFLIMDEDMAISKQELEKKI